MSLGPGTRLGPYEIFAAIGAGGMGEVYRATDTNLGRQVAIKVLPEVFAQDAERLARFEREAKTLASLNHPHIAQIYGLEKSSGVQALVMELVEGEDLSQRIARGPIPLDETLPIATQIAEALEAAHEQGIIHRDLKPANIKVRPDGTVKVLDFGLAKALEATAAASSSASMSPTLSLHATMGGVILGTAAYMSPEQARGKTVDKRADIWAFGCVLYEMLTGKRAFAGEDVSETLAAVLKGEPDWRALPASTPAVIRRLLRRCLQKDTRERLHDISDARIEIQDAKAEVVSEGAVIPVQVVTRRRGRLAWAVAVVVIVSAGVVASIPYFRRAPAEAPPVRFTVGPPETGVFDSAPSFLALSPDGSKLAFVASVSSGRPRQLWIRALDSLVAQPLAGTDGAAQPFWSADGRFLAFHADRSLKKIAISGGPAQTLTGGVPAIGGGTWSHDGVVLFAPGAAPPITIQRVSVAGGAATPVTTLDASRQEVAHVWPRFLPDGKHFLYLAASTQTENTGVYVGSLDSTERTRLLNARSNATYSLPGYLLFSRDGTLMAQPFDAERIQLTGEPVAIAEGLQVTGVIGIAAFAASENGVLAYRAGGAQAPRTLVWVTRNGAGQALAAPARIYGEPKISPDGRRVVMEIEGQIWVQDLVRETLTRLTFEGTTNLNPTWTPDGKRIAFQSNKDSVSLRIFWQVADGSGGLERLTTDSVAGNHTPTSWSPDGQLLAFHHNHPSTQRDIWVLRLSDRKAQPFLQTPFTEGGATFSPDGRWLAYVSNESGRPEIYVRPYPGPGGKWQISVDGGTEPVWGRNGRELFYRSGNKMMAVETMTKPSFSAGKPRMLFEGPYLTNVFPAMSAAYDVSADGQRFLMVKQGEQVPSQINVVLNWFEELKRLVPTN